MSKSFSTNNNNNQQQNASSNIERVIIPSAKRKRITPKRDRGLPPDETLREFAALYIEYVTKLWPELKKKNLLPENTPQTIEAMVESFKSRHRTREIETDFISKLKDIVSIGAMYPRYSDRKSQAKSISDQAFQILQKARRHDCFIPWELVFADYARSATKGHRQGFESLIGVLKEYGPIIDMIFIDDFQRGSRNDEQWWQIAGVCKNKKIELYCASDGFNLQDPNWEEMLRLYNLISSLEGKFRKMRVRRGLRGAAQRHRVRGKLSLGFARTPELDGSGNQIMKPDGNPFMVPCIDPDTSKYRKKMYELFVKKKWSFYKIAQFFNRAKINDWAGWVDTGIRSTLENPDAIGVFIFNRTFLDKDYESKKWERKPNPRSEWDVYYDPSLAIISIEMWRATKRRMAEIRRKRKSGSSQPGRTASTLFSKALVCGYCGKELTLGRSAGNHKQAQCSNGRRRRHSCQLTTTKSIRIIENCILDYLKTAIFTEANLSSLLTKANSCLAEDAARPREDVGPLKRTLAKLDRNKTDLFTRSSQITDPDLKDAYDEQIARVNREMKGLRNEIKGKELGNIPTPPPINLDCISRYLTDLRAILNQEIPAAAEALHELTGSIRITQVKKPGKKSGGAWIATFTPRLVKLLRNFAKDADYPESRTMEFLNLGKWIPQNEHTVLLDQVPPNLSQAPEFGARFQAGETVEELARTEGLSSDRAEELVDFALKGIRPRSSKEKKAAIIRDIEPDVVRLRDRENRSFSEIERWFAEVKQLKVSRYWIIEAWDNAHPEEIAAARAEGRRPRRGRFCHHSDKTIKQIEEELKEGRFNIAEIARRNGVSEPTVRRQLKNMVM